MLKPKLLEIRGKFPTQPFTNCAKELWLEFFDAPTVAYNVAYWTIEADSGTVKLSARNSNVHEDGPDWRPSAPFVVLVEGIVEAFSEQPKSAYKELRFCFREWAEKGILDALQTVRVSRKLNESLNSHDFSIVSTVIDEGLAESVLSLIWSNSKFLTVEKIKSDQAAATKSSKKR